MNTNSSTEWAIYNNPIPLLEVTNKRIIAAIDNYLPYSTGMEIECLYANHFKDTFKDIPDLIEYYNSSSTTEQRYRIPNGLKGLVCLYRICEELKKNCEYHPESGHHYHVDFTDFYDFLLDKKLIMENLDWILPELDAWGYTGQYNTRLWDYNGNKASSWIYFSHHKTIEFRCADMTFSYEIMVKRIIHANDITRRLKKLVYLSPSERKIALLNQELEEVNKRIPNFNDINKQQASNQIKSRIIKI